MEVKTFVFVSHILSKTVVTIASFFRAKPSFVSILPGFMSNLLVALFQMHFVLVHDC